MGTDVLGEIAAWLDVLDAAALRGLLLPSVSWRGYRGYGDDAATVLEGCIPDGDSKLIGLIEEVIGEAARAIAEISCARRAAAPLLS